MAKVFKIIMNIILVIFIAALCAVFIPPLLGITTAVATPGTESNMQTGSIAYGVKESLSDLNAGDNIIVNLEDSTYLYEVVEVDASNGDITVRTSEDSDTEIIQLRRTASRSIIVIPLLGYVFIATQSFTGLIILALVAAFIIILSIIASVLNRQYDDEDDEDDEEGKKSSDYRYFKDLAASTSRPNRLDELGTMTIPTITDEDIQKSQERFSNTDSLNEQIEEISELILEPSSAEPEKVPEETINLDIPEPVVNDNIQETEVEVPEPEDTQKTVENVQEADESSQETESVQDSDDSAKETESAKKEAESTKEAEAGNENKSDSEYSGLAGALEDALDSEQMKEAEALSKEAPSNPVPAQTEEDQTESEKETPSEVELAIPVRSLDELLQEAYANGEDPQVKKDPSTGITLVDYSSSF